MKKLALTLTILAAAPLAASADVSKEDIKKLVGAGVGEEVILSFIRSHGPVAKLSADDLIELKQAGASEKVLAAMAGNAPAPAAAPQPQYADRPVAAPSATYVVSSPAYSYDYYSYPYFSYYWPSYYYSSCYPRYSYSYYPRYGYSYCYPRFGYSYSGYSYPRRYGSSVRY